MTLKNDHHHKLFPSIQIPNLSYQYYLNEGYKRHQVGYQLNDALICYDAAINIRPYRAQAYYNRSLLNILLKNNSQALSDIKAAISSQYLRIALDHKIIQYKKEHLLEQAIIYSKNNYVARQILHMLSGCGFQEFRHNYWVMCQNSNGIVRQHNSVAPGYSYRLSGQSQSSNKQYYDQQQLKDLLKLYNKLKQNEIDTISYIKTQTLVEHDNDNIRSNLKSRSNSLSTDLQVYNIIINKNIQTYNSKQKSPFLQVPAQNSWGSLSQISEFNAMNSVNHIFQHQALRQSSLTVNSFSLNHKNCHSGCTKCKRSHNDSLYMISHTQSTNPKKQGLKMEIKTVQIYRSPQIANPRPYIIFNQCSQNGEFLADTQIVTEVDYKGAYFPQWGALYFFVDTTTGHSNRKIQNKQNQNEERGRKCKIQLWHKDYKSDILIGTTIIQPKKGRYKCSLSNYCPKQMKKKKTAYFFVEIKN